MTDLTCLADGIIYPADFALTGVNLNEIVVGPTGCGKSFSTAYPRLLHTTNSSVVIPIAKKAIKDMFAEMFAERGYSVVTLDFSHPERCNIGYDPLDYIHTDEDVIQTARNLICSTPSRTMNGESDPYWNNSATSVLAAEISVVRLINQNPSFADVIDLHRSMIIRSNGKLMENSLDRLFEYAANRYPGNQACELWKTVQNLSMTTASCIFSIVNNALDKIFSESVLSIVQKRKRIRFQDLGKRKIALFVITSPMNKSLTNMINLMYADMFRSLFELAEEKENNRLNIPVHIICDDFACGSKIHGFEDYISIFRAAGISVTMLLQSESQLISMYGDSAATTIINNCDTYVYMGGMDIKTCENISKRMNKPLERVLSMPLEQVVVFRRGKTPAVARRYQILDDPIYKKMLQKQERKTQLTSRSGQSEKDRT